MEEKERTQGSPYNSGLRQPTNLTGDNFGIPRVTTTTYEPDLSGPNNPLVDYINVTDTLQSQGTFTTPPAPAPSLSPALKRLTTQRPNPSIWDPNFDPFHNSDFRDVSLELTGDGGVSPKTDNKRSLEAPKISLDLADSHEWGKKSTEIDLNSEDFVDLPLDDVEKQPAYGQGMEESMALSDPIRKRIVRKTAILRGVNLLLVLIWAGGYAAMFSQKSAYEDVNEWAALKNYIVAIPGFLIVWFMHIFEYGTARARMKKYRDENGLPAGGLRKLKSVFPFWMRSDWVWIAYGVVLVGVGATMAALE